MVLSQVAPAGFESAQLVQHARIQILEYTGALRAQQFKSVLSAEDMALLRVWTGRVKQVTNTNASTQISTRQQVRRTKADL